ncbi:MAG TPA: hypothetical protein VFU16_05040 [Solirubrobacterales bacterium]|nr:hypothetical protein [Solirubrobacterales bacterium]
MSPTAGRLLATGETALETLNVEADPQAMEVVRGLVETGARTLEDEGTAADEKTVRAAEARLVYVLTSASLGSETSETSESTRDLLLAFPTQPTTLDAATLASFIDGICPLWPFCT